MFEIMFALGHIFFKFKRLFETVQQFIAIPVTFDPLIIKNLCSSSWKMQYSKKNCRTETNPMLTTSENSGESTN